MKNVMDGWISVYRKEQKERQWQNAVKQLQEMISEEGILKFDQSDQDKASQKILFSQFITTNVSMKPFVAARDYLLTSLCLDSASRCGALANMTLEEFKNGSI